MSLEVFMTIRVAVGSSDGKYINQHFGHSQKFLIFDIEKKLIMSILKHEIIYLHVTKEIIHPDLLNQR